MGEYFFNSGAHNLSKARQSYARASKSKKPRIYSFAVYKLAWCDYNLTNYDDSLSKFKEVVRYSLDKTVATGKGQMSKKDQIQLIEEALSDMVRTYSHLDAVDDAYDYYVDIKKKAAAYEYLRKLGDRYMGEGKYAVAIKMFRKLNEDPDYQYHAKAPQNQATVMEAFGKLNKKSRVKDEADRMVNLYNPKSLWAEKNAGNQRALDSAFEQVEQRLGQMVTEQHKEAQDSKAVKTYQIARDLYRRYLGAFPASSDSYQFRFYLAEILFELKEFKDAAAEYALVAQKEDGKFRKDSAYSTILAWQKVYTEEITGKKEKLGTKIVEGKCGKSKGALKKLQKVEIVKEGKTYEREELTSTETALAAACDFFVQVAPDDEGVVKVKFQSAQLYYKHNQFDEASVRFGEIIERWPKDELGRTAAEMVVQSYNVRKDWKQLNHYARKFRENKMLMADKKFAKAIQEYVEGASFQEIVTIYEKQESLEQVAKRWVDYAEEFPKTKFSMLAVFNSIGKYREINKLEEVIKYSKVILKDFKAFKLTKEEIKKSQDPGKLREITMYSLAKTYEGLAEFQLAVELYEEFLDEYKKPTEKEHKRSDIRYNVAFLRKSLGQFDKAIKHFDLYMKENPKAEDIADREWDIGELFLQKKDFKAAEKHFGAVARNAKKRADKQREICAEWKVVEALKEQNRASTAVRNYSRIESLYDALPPELKGDDCALTAKATINFEATDKSYQEYLALPLNGRTDTDIQKKIEAKKKLMGELIQDFKKFDSIGHAGFIVGALYRIGTLYADLNDRLLNEVTCPAKIGGQKTDDDICEQFMGILEEMSYEYADSARQGLELALTSALKKGIYNEWMLEAQKSVFALMGRTEKSLDYTLLATDELQSAPELAEVLQ